MLTTGSETLLILLLVSALVVEECDSKRDEGHRRHIRRHRRHIRRHIRGHRKSVSSTKSRTPKTTVVTKVSSSEKQSDNNQTKHTHGQATTSSYENLKYRTKPVRTDCPPVTLKTSYQIPTRHHRHLTSSHEKYLNTKNRTRMFSITGSPSGKPKPNKSHTTNAPSMTLPSTYPDCLNMTNEKRTRPIKQSTPFSTTDLPSAEEEEKSRPEQTSKDKLFSKLTNYKDFIDVKNRSQVQDVVKTFADILSKDTATNQINEDIKAIQLVENIAKNMALQMKPRNKKPPTVGTVVGEQVFGVVSMNGSGLSGFSFPNEIEDLEQASSFGACVHVPNSVLVASESDRVALVFMIYNPSSEMNARTGDHPESINLAEKVVLASVFPQPKPPFNEPVVITIKNTTMYSNTTVTPTCAYLMENSSSNRSETFGMWSTKGCQLVQNNSSHFTCHCYHLTNFAILLQFDENKLPEEHEMALSIITYIGLSLSIIGCLLTFTVHLLFPKLWNERGFIHMNMVASLGIADTVFMFETLPEVNSTSCTVVAMILFYFYLAVFSWMLLEGIHIYRMLVKVFGADKDSRKVFFLAGWGIPLVIVTASALVYQDDVTSDYYCWLSATSGAIWMFGVPVVLVIFINIIMLMVVLRTSLHHAKKDKHLQRSMAKTTCTLVPVLGITWVFGIITFNVNFLALQYIFAVLNSLQGFAIFVLYGLCNVEVKKEISQKITAWKTEQDILKEQSNKSSKLKSFDNHVAHGSIEIPPSQQGLTRKTSL